MITMTMTTRAKAPRLDTPKRNPMRCGGLANAKLMSLEEDRQLLEAFRRGERRALERVYRLHVGGVARFLQGGFTFSSAGKTVRFAGTTSRFQLEDWVHEVFVRAFRDQARAQYDGFRPYGPYLARIARNLVVDELRRKEHKLRQHFDELPEPSDVADFGPAPAPSPERVVQERQFAQHVASFVEKLPERERRVYELRFVEGLDQRDVATRVGLSPSKVKTSERRIRSGFLSFLELHGWMTPADRPAEGRSPKSATGATRKAR